MNYIVIFIGGAIGAICRYTLGNFISYSPGDFPMNTFIINMIGCLFLGFFLTYTKKKFSKELILLIGTGFTGAFTTFSTFSLENVKLIEDGQLITSFLYVFISLGIGICLSYLGYLLAVQILKRKGESIS
ncbi:fluoride efflux transporter CrcB [Bacillus sp. RG28]|uniref:Fluoride-specific ion channel FluC n=1 Tax=Gottfriedia endophytica TaxID=2820819 RepID=A0A940NGW1_9BACI|nr:fluoride efflux transporter CrcB [Gottfriedia endophytica]MBP0723762.1 fluoride efflux transporter CrcB [Gottfriedia endophytica]